MRAFTALGALPLLAACQAEPQDPYVERVPLEEAQQFASEPVPSPDVTDAVWAVSQPNERLLYGIPGQTPMLALACERKHGSGTLTFTRFIAADAKAKALMALVGNFHVARIPVDAVWNGRAWLWEGSVDASHGDMDVLTGPREVELTIPGAGSLLLGSSTLPGDMVSTCRTGLPRAGSTAEGKSMELADKPKEAEPHSTPQAEDNLEFGDAVESETAAQD